MDDFLGLGGLFDMDDDGEYSKHEVMFVNNTANDRAVEAVELIGHVEMSYDLALIDYEAAQSTPRPTARPTPQPTKKPSTSSGRSYADPYNARDYSDPDDFYFDYYDDFFDYEDAEDYWYEHQ